MYGMSAAISPNSKTDEGFTEIEALTYKCMVFCALTGTKFVLISEPQASDMHATLRKVYEAYADYVLKNPFY